MRANPETQAQLSELTFWLPGFLGVIALSFVAATGVVHWRLRAVDHTAIDIATTAAPSIEHLAAARGQVRHLQLQLHEELGRRARSESIDPNGSSDAQRALDGAVNGYLTLPLLPHERELWTIISRDKSALDEAVASFEREASRGDLAAATSTLNGPIAANANGLDEAMSATIEADANQVHEFALRIQDLRTRSTYAAFGLDVLCTLIALCAAIAIRRMLRARAEHVERNRRLRDERESALDDFSGRVAHDILSPLSTVGFALQLAVGAGDEEQRRRLLGRGTAALERVKTLVSDLLELARAGGKPAPDARADLARTIDDLMAELEPTAAEAGAELSAKQVGPCLVACSRGVLTSLIANLARNAMKYLGDAPVRRIEIRVLDRGASVRVEVEDTGPGLPPAIEKRVFEPFVRSPDASQPGVGLGLATVKRLAEAHGGSVGVRSFSGRGSTFWFEIPKAKPAAADTTPDQPEPRGPWSPSATSNPTGQRRHDDHPSARERAAQ